jgi:drug/metabolite transporter (DMT)-like permease
MPAIGTTALLLIAGTALGWSALDVLRKLLAPHLSPFAVVFFLALGQVPVLALWGATMEAGPLTGRYLLVAAASVLHNIVANAAYVAALSRSPLSVSVPLLSLTPAFVATFARPLLGEWPHPVQLVGIALVVAGALLLGGAAAEGGSLAAWWQALRREPGARLMLLVAVCWGLTLPLDKLGVGMVGPARHSLVLVSGIAAGTLALMLALGTAGELTRRVRGRVLPILLASVAVSAVALVLQLLVIQVALVGVVEAVKRAVGNLVALLVGASVFGEGVGWKKVVSLVLLVAGVALILLT